MYREIKIGELIEKGEILYATKYSVSMNFGDKLLVEEDSLITSANTLIRGTNITKNQRHKALESFKLMKKISVETLSIF